MAKVRERMAGLAPSPLAGEGRGGGVEPAVRLVEYDPDAERKVVAAALFSQSNLPFGEQTANTEAVLEAMLGDRANRRQRPPRALEHAEYTFEISANFAAYRDLHRHRQLTQDRQLLGADLGYDLPPGVGEVGIQGAFAQAIEEAGAAHRQLERQLGPALAQ